jgi:hypothetical protein
MPIMEPFESSNDYVLKRSFLAFSNLASNHAVAFTKMLP